MDPHPVRCNFYVRTSSEDGRFHYDLVSVAGLTSNGSLHTFHPPAIGDRLPLSDEFGQVPGAVYQVIERSWLYPAYGSALWPHGTPSPQVGPTLDILVERCDGMFMDESDLPSPFRGD